MASALAAAAVLVAPPVRSRDCFRQSSNLLRIVLLQCFEPQLQLLDLPIQFLRRTPELHATQLGDQQLQLFDFTVARQRSVHVARRSVLSVRRDSSAVEIRKRRARSSHAAQYASNKFQLSKSILNKFFYTAICGS